MMVPLSPLMARAAFSNEEMYDFLNFTLSQAEGVEVINFFIIPKILYNIDEWLPISSDFKE
jgi:hypothetical protein